MTITYANVMRILEKLIQDTKQKHHTNYHSIFKK